MNSLPIRHGGKEKNKSSQALMNTIVVRYLRGGV